MDNTKRLEITGKSLFFSEDISRVLGLGRAAAAVYCSRATKRGELLYVKRGLYLLASAAKNLSARDRFAISNLIVTPSYVSLMSALSFHEMTTQHSISTIDAVTTMQRRTIETASLRWNYFQLNKKYYFDFERIDGAFIATPEKAMIDAALLASFGRYSLDIASIDFAKFDWKKVEKLARNFPQRTKNLLAKWRDEYA